MNTMNKLLFLILFLPLLLGACVQNPQQDDSASVANEAVTASPSLPPTDTPIPSDTPTSTPEPTNTPQPTDTPTATRTKKPTNTPTITPTPGPFSFFDDFTTNSGGWEECEGCEWTNGTLVMGPYDPSSYFHDNYCTACVAHDFYRLAVDVTFIDGEVDRFFGVTFAEGENHSYYLGISPWGYYNIARWHWDKQYWEDIAFEQSSAVVGSYGTNHIEIIVQPATQPDFADYYIYLNDVLVKVIYTLEVEPTWVGLAMNYHAQVVAYDNWEYVEIEP